MNHKVGKGTLITQNLYFLPGLQHTSQYRTAFKLGTVTKICKWLRWENQSWAARPGLLLLKIDHRMGTYREEISAYDTSVI